MNQLLIDAKIRNTADVIRSYESLPSPCFHGSYGSAIIITGVASDEFFSHAHSETFCQPAGLAFHNEG